MRNVQVEKLIDKLREHENRIETLEAQTVELMKQIDSLLVARDRLETAVEQATGYEREPRIGSASDNDHWGGDPNMA